MLIEVREVEVRIDPSEVFSQALQDGELSVGHIVRECVYEESLDAVLNALDADDIEAYCERNGLCNSTPSFEVILKSVRELSQEHKALLLWQLIRGANHGKD